LLHGRAKIVATIQTVQQAHFYKSMTAHGNTSPSGGDLLPSRAISSDAGVAVKVNAKTRGHPDLGRVAILWRQAISSSSRKIWAWPAILAVWHSSSVLKATIMVLLFQWR